MQITDDPKPSGQAAPARRKRFTFGRSPKPGKRPSNAGIDKSTQIATDSKPSDQAAPPRRKQFIFWRLRKPRKPPAHAAKDKFRQIIDSPKSTGQAPAPHGKGLTTERSREPRKPPPDAGTDKAKSIDKRTHRPARVNQALAVLLGLLVGAGLTGAAMWKSLSTERSALVAAHNAAARARVASTAQVMRLHALQAALTSTKGALAQARTVERASDALRQANSPADTRSLANCILSGTTAQVAAMLRRCIAAYDRMNAN